MYSASCFHLNVKILYWKCLKAIVFITNSRHGFAKEQHRKKNTVYHKTTTTDRLAKRPQTENINVWLDSWQSHLYKTENRGFQRPLQDPLEPPWNPPDSPWPPQTPNGPQGCPKTLRIPQIWFISLKGGTHRHLRRTSKDPFDSPSLLREGHEVSQ